jgi:hypothetical protein
LQLGEGQGATHQSDAGGDAGGIECELRDGEDVLGAPGFILILGCRVGEAETEPVGRGWGSG